MDIIVWSDSMDTEAEFLFTMQTLAFNKVTTFSAHTKHISSIAQK